MKKKAEEVKGVDVAKIMKDTPVEKSDRFMIEFECMGKEIIGRDIALWKTDWEQNLTLTAMEFDLGEETESEVSLKVRFIGVKAYEILRSVLNCRFNIKVILLDREGLDMHNFLYDSVILEEVYGLQLSNLSKSQVPNFIARFHKRKREDKEHTGWSKRL
jgi:hypothetical protein